MTKPTAAYLPECSECRSRYAVGDDIGITYDCDILDCRALTEALAADHREQAEYDELHQDALRELAADMREERWDREREREALR